MNPRLLVKSPSLSIRLNIYIRYYSSCPVICRFFSSHVISPDFFMFISFTIFFSCHLALGENIYCIRCLEFVSELLAHYLFTYLFSDIEFRLIGTLDLSHWASINGTLYLRRRVPVIGTLDLRHRVPVIGTLDLRHRVPVIGTLDTAF